MTRSYKNKILKTIYPTKRFNHNNSIQANMTKILSNKQQKKDDMKNVFIILDNHFFLDYPLI